METLTSLSSISVGTKLVYLIVGFILIFLASLIIRILHNVFGKCAARIIGWVFYCTVCCVVCITVSYILFNHGFIGYMFFSLYVLFSILGVVQAIDKPSVNHTRYHDGNGYYARTKHGYELRTSWDDRIFSN